MNMENSYKGIYASCRLKGLSLNKNSSFLIKCTEWVYSKEYFKSTLFSEVNQVK